MWILQSSTPIILKTNPPWAIKSSMHGFYKFSDWATRIFSSGGGVICKVRSTLCLHRSFEVGNYDVFRKICDQMTDVIPDGENRFIKAAALKKSASVNWENAPPPEIFHLICTNLKDHLWEKVGGLVPPHSPVAPPLIADMSKKKTSIYFDLLWNSTTLRINQIHWYQGASLDLISYTYMHFYFSSNFVRTPR